MLTFNPPIEDRTTKQLLLIVGSPNEWDESAIEQAQLELTLRNVDESEIKQAKHQSKQKVRLEDLKRAKESYSFFDFIFEPSTFIEVIVSWELRKDGYLRKADQQQWLRPIFILVMIMIIVILSL
ncbi:MULTISPECIES: hypothetical protein [unclassified Pedobacter]|uniref:hypothetical protein n=1 Tax=unclassified Pedobacter TaxID=2628915 RepID=UPI001421D57D|nr:MULTISPECIES: hypothetical protein [unclassified Pedobacter]NII81639.1 hypothetical protein [Pedobacter sp. SG908]NMN35643.1 hypothetical protein [Pedobacter sp. SG918]